MSRIRYYIRAMRLRTLPLSLAGVALGIFLAAADYHVRWEVVLFTVLTTLSLQMLSNVSNELGDALRGTDREDRQGPSYSLSSGLLSKRDFKFMIWMYALLSAGFGLALIWFSFGTFFSYGAIIVMLLGVAAISGAMKYTLGRNPYGYKGYGDLNVFIYFGIVAVLGSYFVAAHEIPNWFLLLPAASVGCLSAAVLNVNNIRDMESDAATRRTIPVRIGEKKAKVYHAALISAGWIFMLAYSFSRAFDWWHYLYVLTLPLFIIHIVRVAGNSGKALDPQLPFLVVSTFLFAVLAGTGFVVFLF